MRGAPGQQWGGGGWPRRCVRLLDLYGGTIPRSELEQLGVRSTWELAPPPHPNPLSEGQCPATPSLVHGGSGQAAVETRVAAWERQLRALPRRVRRALQRHFALPLADLALILALWQGPAWAATINVDGVTCTLAEAITAANDDNSNGNGCSDGSGADTLVLPAFNTLTLTAVDNTTYGGGTGLPVVSSIITIAGQGSTLERSGSAPAFRLLAVGSGGDLTVRDLTLQGGSPSGAGGGGIFNVGTLTLANCTVTGNTAGSGGGGVASYDGTLTIVHSTLSGNTALYSGGGVVSTGTLTVANSMITGNTGFNSGGGVGTLISATPTNSTLMHSTITGNTAAFGGGVANFGGSVTLTNSTLSGNAATDDGGGVFSSSGTVTLTNSTVSGNAATDDGGGVYTADSLTLAQTLVSGNTVVAGSGPEIYNTTTGTVSADQVNLFGQDNTSGVEGFTPGATDIIPGEGVTLSDILTPSLAFNGGPTQTYNLVSGSPAVDAVTAGGCPPTDQRGFVRPVDGDAVNGPACDIGAVELAASPPPVVNSRVSFVALPATFGATMDATGCPAGFAGKFFFQAELTNLAGSPPLVALKDQAVELSHGNLVQTADGGPAGVESLQTLPEVGAFSDGVLEATGTLQVPFIICLQTLNPFRFTVNALGLELSP
jgi:hypothetical protein